MTKKEAKAKITVMYDCPECGLSQVKVSTRPRFPNEDILSWTRTVMVSCAADHTIRSPLCRPKTLDLYMPLPPRGKGIGEEAIRPEADGRGV